MKTSGTTTNKAKLNNLQGAILALAMQTAKKKGIPTPVKKKMTNVEAARLALQKKKFTTSYPQKYEAEFNPSTGAIFRGRPLTKRFTVSKEVWKGLEYRVGIDQNGVAFDRDDYRMRVMKEILNAAYEQRAKASYPIYTTDESGKIKKLDGNGGSIAV